LNVSQALSTKTKSSLAARSDPEARYIDPPSFTRYWDDPIMEDEIFGPLLQSLSIEIWMRHP